MNKTLSYVTDVFLLKKDKGGESCRLISKFRKKRLMNNGGHSQTECLASTEKDKCCRP